MNRYIFLFWSFLLCLSSCSGQDKNSSKEIKVEILSDSIVTPYCYFSEIKVISDDKNNTQKLLKNIQLLSENNTISASNPEKRINQKKDSFKACNNSENCNYIPESYEVLSSIKNYLSIKYSYNAFRNPDEYYKYACFDLVKQERLTYNKIFEDFIALVNEFNKRYVSGFNDYLKDLDTKNEDDVDEYDTIKDHIETRSPFTLTDLNNFELVFKNNSLTHIRFHYNGQGGVYKSLFPPDYEQFSLKEMTPYLSDSFKKDMGLK